MTNRTVLISGAGVAGPTLAYWLARHGYRPTVVERAQGMRSSGNPIDVRGPAMAVAHRMGIVPALQAKATAVTELTFLNAAGRRVGRMPMPPQTESIELPRMDLATVLLDAARDDAEFVFGDSISTLQPDADGVDVTFDHGEPRRFDLVVGADGVHSWTRRLVFGDESQFVEQLGLWVATLAIDGLGLDPRQVLMYNEPGRALSLHPGSGKPIAAFIWRSPADPGYDYRDTADHKRRLAEAYAGGGWRIPEMLRHAGETDDLYFDAVSRVSLERWSAGRVVLLGDAASSVSLFGDGSTLAMAGAATLADALAAHPADHETAFRAYEAAHRKLVEPKQNGVGQASKLLIPSTRLGIGVRNAASNVLAAIRR
ncbi:MAG: monooxygenase [Hamadaea sp.]|uniref:FAD-dependent monooxygenase n=1 Tax=Hamadaea sp. TaxID=2024425 RepID=UPI0017D78405|nr:FAD-dependent monooxygenase [Hamadaea sp.]NUT19863.1 monooxygenase [Hamadaea sp.]